MEDELEREPTADDIEESDELAANELDAEGLEKAAGGDPGYTHPDTQGPYIP